MTAPLRDAQRGALLEALGQVGPSAPTLCAGWDAHDLAIHIWQLQHDPRGWLLTLPMFAARARARMDGLKQQWRYADLLTRMRADPGSLACMPLDRLGDHRHALGEYFVHTADVTRANGLPEPLVSPDMADALWLRACRAAQILRRSEGLLLVRPDGLNRQIGRGPVRCMVSGEPGELILWVYGRGPAQVVIGDPPRQ